MGDKQTLSGLLGSYDNLHEEVPFVNKRDTILGVTISLTVRCPPSPLTSLEFCRRADMRQSDLRCYSCVPGIVIWL